MADGQPGRFHDLTGYFVYLLFVATLGPLLFGYHLAELNAPQDVITCAKESPEPDPASSYLPQCIPMNPFQFGLVSSIFTLGGLVGALSAGNITAKYGRLKAMRYTTLVFMLGPLVESTATVIGALAVGRFISGLGAGAALVVAPLFVSEISPIGNKGFFGATTQLMINIGILVSEILGMFLSRGQYWRIILGTGGLIGLLQLLSLGLAVESPKWTASQGAVQKAKRDLQKVRGPQVDLQRDFDDWGIREIDAPNSEEEGLLDPSGRSNSAHSEELSMARASSRKDTIGIFGVLLHSQYRKATLTIMMIMAAQQFTGINSIVMYGVHLLAQLFTSSSALLNVVVSAFNAIVTASCAPLIDKIGRKKCLFISIVGMGISSLLIGIAIQNGIHILSAITVLTFVGSFAIGLGPVPFILASELVGPEAVGATQSWALASNWISTFVVAQFFPPLNEALGGGKVYYVFTAFAVVFACLVASLVPETKGLQVSKRAPES